MTVTVEPDPATIDAEVERALAATVWELLSPAAAALTTLYLVFAVGHLLVLPVPVARPMAALAGVSSAVFGVLWWRLARGRPRTDLAHRTAAFMGGLILINSAVHLALFPEPYLTTNFFLLAIGVGLVFLSVRWLALVLLATVASWAAIVATAPPSPQWNHFGFSLLAAVLLSVAVHAGRLRARRGLEVLRLHNERQGAALRRAKEAAEQRQIELENSRKELQAQNGELARANVDLEVAQRRTERVFSALAAALPGTVLDGKYRLEKKIGAGAFATVFHAEHVGLRNAVAVKVFRPWEGNDSPLALERFRREGVSACRVNHPNAVSVLDSGISQTGIAYLVMELLRGSTLAEVLMRDGRLPFDRCAEILGPVCHALAEAHDAGLVHRDIKPDNIFLHQTPRGEVVKVLDFGIAKLVSDAAQDERNANAEQTRGLVGTPSYVAPERVAGRDYDGRADVYGVGVTLYVMLTGRLPFPAAKGQSPFATAWMHVSQDPIPPQTVRPDLRPEVAAFVLRVLARDPDGRPTARQMAGELEVLRSVS